MRPQVDLLKLGGNIRGNISIDHTDHLYHSYYHHKDRKTVMRRREGLYIQYERFKNRYLDAQRMYDTILSEKEELFSKTQPKTVSYDKEKISGGHGTDAFEQYIMDLERKKITQRLNEIKSLMDDRGHLLELKEQELRQSKDLYDRIYSLRYLEHRKPENIAHNIGYSVSQIYRILTNIDERCDKMRKHLC